MCVFFSRVAALWGQFVRIDCNREGFSEFYLCEHEGSNRAVLSLTGGTKAQLFFVNIPDQTLVMVISIAVTTFWRIYQLNQFLIDAREAPGADSSPWRSSFQVQLRA